VNRKVELLLGAGLAALVLAAGIMATSRAQPGGRVSIEFVGSRPGGLEHPPVAGEQVTFLIRNPGRRAAELVLSYLETNGGSGWKLDRSGPLGPAQQLGEVKGESSKTISLRLTERSAPWRVQVMVYERATLLEKARFAVWRMYERLRLGADAGRGPHLVDDQFLEGYDVVTPAINAHPSTQNPAQSLTAYGKGGPTTTR
jgi:hypothetical protein